MKKLVAGLAVLALALAAFLTVLYVGTPVEPAAQACTEEAMICPDGSAVGRTGPNCEFAACPVAAPTPTPIPTPTPVPATRATSTPIAIGERVAVGNTTIGVIELLEDSRCPTDVQCIWAGRVRVRAALDAMSRDFTFVLAEPQVVGRVTVTLVAVVPGQKVSTQTIPPSAYRFIFTVVPATAN